HPINQGGLCPRGQAAIQMTYHPDRIVQPMKRRGGRATASTDRGVEFPNSLEQFEPVSWDDAIAQLVQKLDVLADARDQKSVMFLTRPRRSRRLELIAEFLSRYGAPPPTVCEIFGDDVLRRANRLAFGRDQLPTFDLARARFVIVFGADLLGTWNSPVAQNAAYGAMRQGRPGVRGKLVQVESRMSATGACADEWIPAKPGTEAVLALGLPHVILNRN